MAWFCSRSILRPHILIVVAYPVSTNRMADDRSRSRSRSRSPDNRNGDPGGDGGNDNNMMPPQSSSGHDDHNNGDDNGHHNGGGREDGGNPNEVKLYIGNLDYGAFRLYYSSFSLCTR